MTTIYLASHDSLICVRGGNGHWEARRQLHGRAPRSLAVDRHRPERVWCGTAGDGLWRSVDAGASWHRAGAGLAAAHVSAVAVSPHERAGEDGVVYAGTDPSALFRSEDGGATWEELTALRALPSASSWSFPPRPETSHVRWITLDPSEGTTLYVCIEAGALVRSRDGGRTWLDRMPGGPLDTHTLEVHPEVPGRLYSAAGDGVMGGHGYNESWDGGDSWTHPEGGLEHHYLYGLAVDPGDPGTVVVSAAESPRAAHDPGRASATSTGVRVTSRGARCGTGCRKPVAACGRCWRHTLPNRGCSTPAAIAASSAQATPASAGKRCACQSRYPWSMPSLCPFSTSGAHTAAPGGSSTPAIKLT